MTDINLPGYEIAEKLGLGGMATVYKARHINLDRDVAIKIMAPALNADPSFTERFIREARISARLSHPAIVQVYDVNTVNGINYIAMEYVSGGDLNDLMHHPCDTSVISDVLGQLCHALDYASRMGYVHRDIKPSNILIREDASFVLADFGIARASESNTQMTITGSVIGTPSYMSPEQAQGTKLDGRADLYSLAVVCYEMLTRELPFSSDSSISTALKHITEPVPTLTDDLAVFQPFFDRAMAKKPEQRFQSGIEMAHSFGDIVDSLDDKTIISIQRTVPIRPNAPSGSHGSHVSNPRLSQGGGNYRYNSGQHSASHRQVSGQHSSFSGIHTQNGAAVEVSDTVTPSPFSAPARDRISPGKARAKRVENPPSNRGWVFAVSWLLLLLIGSGVAWFLVPADTKQDLVADLSDLLLQKEDGQTQDDGIAQLLDKARYAVATGKDFQPEGNSAYDYYQSVIKVDPSNVAANSGLKDLLGATVDKANKLIEMQDFETASLVLKDAARIDSSNAYLLSTRKKLHSRYKSNGDRLAGTPRPAKPTEKVDVDVLLQRAQQQLEQGRLVLPLGDNARDSFLAVLEQEPNNMQARKGLNSIAATYLGSADIAIHKGRFDDAQEYLDIVEQIAPGDPRIEAVRKAIADEQGSSSDKAATLVAEPVDEVRIDELLAEAQLNMKQGASDLDSRDRAGQLLKEALQLAPANEQALALQDQLFGQYLESAKIQKDKGNFQSARRALVGARAIKPQAQLDIFDKSAEELITQGAEFEQSSEYEEAVMAYLEAMLIEPENPEINPKLHNLATLYLAKIEAQITDGDSAAAAATQEEALKWFPQSESIANAIDGPSDVEQVVAVKTQVALNPASEPPSAPKTESKKAPIPAKQAPVKPKQKTQPSTAALLAALQEELEGLSADEKTQLLLDKAQGYKDNDQWMKPNDANAYSAYQAILKMDPGNEAASEGVSSIAYHYTRLVKMEIEEGSVSEARANLGYLQQLGASELAVRILGKKIDARTIELEETKKLRETTNALVEEAYSAIDNADLSTAKKLYYEAKKLSPESETIDALHADLLEAYQTISMAEYSNGDYHRAIALAEQGLKIEPNDEYLKSVIDDSELAGSANADNYQEPM